MSDYTKSTNFEAKDALPTGNPGKIAKGKEVDDEFDAIATMSTTKVDKTGTYTAITSITPAANKLLRFTGASTADTLDFLDEDTMSSDSATAVASQQSIKAYAAPNISTQTIYIPASAMISRITSGAAWGLVESTTNKVMLSTLDFDAATEEYAQFSIRMPKGWDEGTVTASFVWSTVGSLDVVWGLQAVAISNDDAFDASFGTAQTVTDTTTLNTDIMESAQTSAITIGGTPTEADWVVYQVYRYASTGGDTNTSDARLHGVVLLYQTASMNDA